MLGESQSAKSWYKKLRTQLYSDDTLPTLLRLNERKHHKKEKKRARPLSKHININIIEKERRKEHDRETETSVKAKEANTKF